MAYTNSFWDSIRGARLADTLIKQLPRLSKDDCEQITVEVKKEETFVTIDSMKSKGFLFYASVPTKEGHVVLIFERNN